MPWDVGDAILEARESDEPHIAVRGIVTFDETQLPGRLRDPMDNAPQNITIQGHIEGHSLSRNGFDTPLSIPLELDLYCIGPWCPSMTESADYLAFIKQRGKRFALHMDPCAPMGFENPSEMQIDSVVTCLRTGRCAGRAK